MVRFSYVKWGDVKASSHFTYERKYIEEISKYFKIDSILIINKHGHLQRLQCPFSVEVIQNVGELRKGLICNVSAAKIDLTLIDVYDMQNRIYYFFNFSVLGRK